MPYDLLLPMVYWINLYGYTTRYTNTYSDTHSWLILMVIQI